MTKRKRDEKEADPGPEAVTSSGGAMPSGAAGEESFGAWLRRHRELREISLREIADTSKISLRYLEALEEERFDLLPAQIFAKGFLRQYARYVGIDPEETVNFFLTASQPEEEAPEVVEARERTRRKPLAGWTYLAVALVAALVLLVLAWGLTRLNPEARGEPEPPASPETPAAAVELPPSRVPATGEAAFDEAPGAGAPGAGAPGAGAPAGESADASTASGSTGADSTTASETAGATLVVTVDFHRDCWVEAAVDGTRQIAEIRVQGESLRLQAEELVEIKVGDAGAVDIEVNGHPFPLEAASGAVATLRIDRETASRLARPPAARPSPG